jgi:hypothetical protein
MISLANSFICSDVNSYTTLEPSTVISLQFCEVVNGDLGKTTILALALSNPCDAFANDQNHIPGKAAFESYHASNSRERKRVRWLLT